MSEMEIEFGGVPDRYWDDDRILAIIDGMVAELHALDPDRTWDATVSMRKGSHTWWQSMARAWKEGYKAGRTYKWLIGAHHNVGEPSNPYSEEERDVE